MRQVELLIGSMGASGGIVLRKGSRATLGPMAVSACRSLLSLANSAQSVGQQPTESFEEAVRVQVVNLEVVVTNREDERVTGLGRNDFVWRVDVEPAGEVVEDAAAG